MASPPSSNPPGGEPSDGPPELSLSPFFARRWSSLYEAFDDAQINRKAMQKLFVSALPSISSLPPRTGTRLVLAADATPIARPQSPTARDRTYIHVPNLPTDAKPVAPGWQFATVVALPETPSSWTTILDNRRIPNDRTPAQTVAAQFQELSPLLRDDALLLCDSGFGNPGFLSQVQSLLQGKLLRLAKNRVLYRAPPPRTGKKGAPKKDGAALRPSDATTYGPPDAQWPGTEQAGHVCEESCWHGLHFKKCREAEVSLLRVCRPHSAGSERHHNERHSQTLWLVWQGADMPPLCEIAALYRRYSIEHSYRFDKQNLLWSEPRLRTPEKFEAWTQVVSAVHNQITLARTLTTGLRHP